MCGPSSGELSAAAAQKDLATTFSGWAKQRFAGQSAVLKSLNSAYDRVINLGPGADGFTPEQLATLNTEAASRAAANYRNTAQAVTGQMAGRQIGGTSGVASGIEAQIRSVLANEASKQLSSEQSAIALKNAEVGQQAWSNALSGKSALLNAYDPTQYSQLASQGLQQTFTNEKDLQQQRGSFWKTLGGIAKTGIGVGMAALTGGASLPLTSMGSLLGGAAPALGSVGTLMGGGEAPALWGMDAMMGPARP